MSGDVSADYTHLEPMQALSPPPEVVATHASSPPAIGDSASSDADTQDALLKQKELGGPALLPPLLSLPDYKLVLENLLKSLLGEAPSSSVLQKLQMQLHAISSSVLDQWVAEIMKEGDLRQEQLAQFLHQQLQREAVQEAIAQGSENASKVGASQTPPLNGMMLLTSGILAFAAPPIQAVAASGQALTVGAISAIPIPSLRLLVDTAFQANKSLPSNLQGPMAQFCAYLSSGLISRATTHSLFSIKAPKPLFNYEFAKNYSNLALAFCKSGDIDKLAKAFLPASLGNLSPQQMVSLVKISILSQALAFSYRLETHWITGQEFASLLKGEMDLDPDDFRHGLIHQIHAELHHSELPPEVKAAYLANLFAYYDSDPPPNLDSLQDGAEALRAMFQNQEGDPQIFG